jgi:hypothetical protein
VIKRIAYFIGGCITLWVVLAIPARRIWGDTAAVHAGVALLLCLVPTTLTLLWSAWARGRSPEQQLIATLGGTGVRLFMVMTAALVLYQFVPFFREQAGFWAWLLVFYLFTLAFEVVLLVTAPAEAPRAGDGVG